MRTSLVLSMLGMVALAGGAELSSGDRAGLFLKAVELARGARTKEELKEAITLYEQTANAFPRGTRNGYLEYDLGNACFRYGDLGRAILHWRRAEQLLPGDPQVAHNLSYGRSRSPDKFETAAAGEVASLVFFWHAWALPTRYWTALLGFAACCAFLALRLFVRRWLVSTAAIACLIVAVAAGVSTALSAYREAAYPAAVVIAPQTIVRQGDSETYEPVFTEPIHGGTEVRIIEERSGWVRAEFPDGKDGWIRRDDVERV
jgi:hypothetical protein